MRSHPRNNDLQWCNVVDAPSCMQTCVRDKCISAKAQLGMHAGVIELLAEPQYLRLSMRIPWRAALRSWGRAHPQPPACTCAHVSVSLGMCPSALQTCKAIFCWWRSATLIIAWVQLMPFAQTGSAPTALTTLARMCACSRTQCNSRTRILTALIWFRLRACAMVATRNTSALYYMHSHTQARWCTGIHLTRWCWFYPHTHTQDSESLTLVATCCACHPALRWTVLARKGAEGTA